MTFEKLKWILDLIESSANCETLSYAVGHQARWPVHKARVSGVQNVEVQQHVLLIATQRLGMNARRRLIQFPHMVVPRPHQECGYTTRLHCHHKSSSRALFPPTTRGHASPDPRPLITLTHLSVWVNSPPRLPRLRPKLSTVIWYCRKFMAAF